MNLFSSFLTYQKNQRLVLHKNFSISLIFCIFFIMLQKTGKCSLFNLKNINWISLTFLPEKMMLKKIEEFLLNQKVLHKKIKYRKNKHT